VAILLVAGGITALGLGSRRSRADGVALVWAATTALFIAGYSLLDKAGVSHANPLAYIIVLFGANALCMAPWVLWRPESRPPGWLRQVRWGRHVSAGLLSLGAYLLVLAAMRLTQVSYVAALRETSVVLASILGWRVLGETYGWRRMAASGVVAVGLVLLVLAMRG
jgi:uncharacterized membrane protein